MKTKVIMLLATGVVLSLGALWAESIEYPSNFRRWVRVGTGVVLPDADTKLMSEEGMHDIFANQVAAKGYASGDFPDGSIIVYELREGKPKSGVIVEGERKRVDVMIRKSRCDKAVGAPLTRRRTPINSIITSSRRSEIYSFPSWTPSRFRFG